jgi:cytochrome c553
MFRLRQTSTLLLLLLGLPISNTNATSQVQSDYMLNCQGCHLPQGEGFPARGVPQIKDSMGKFLKVEGGREFLVQVPGASLSDLSDQRLADVLNWMLRTFSPNELEKTFEAYSAIEVNLLRKSPLTNVNELRRQLIEKIVENEHAN